MSIRTDILSNAPDDVGLTQNAQRQWPWWYKPLQELPPSYAMAGFNAVRTSNTILKGGWASSAFPSSELRVFSPRTWVTRDSMHRQMLQRNPRSIMRYSHMERIDPANEHNVFQMAKLANAPLKWASEGKFGKSISTRMASAGLTPDIPGGKISSPGFIGTQDAATRIRMSGMNAGRASHVADYLKISDPLAYERLGGSVGAEAALADSSSVTGSQVLGMSGGGTLNRLAGGFMRGSLDQITPETFGFMNTGRTIAKQGETGVFKSVALKAASSAAEWLAQGGRLAGEGKLLRGAIPAIRAAYQGTGLQTAIEKFGMDRVGSQVTADALTRATEKAGQTVASDIGTRLVGTVAADAGEQTLKRIGVNVGEKIVASGAERIAEGLAVKGGIWAGTKAGGAVAAALVSQWIPFVDVAMDIYAAYSIGKAIFSAAGEAAKAQARLVKAGMTSFQGSINKAPMSGWRGLGYTDTAAAATSRRRGVHAIQNSRLNARNVLGSEAPMLHAHFG